MVDFSDFLNDEIDTVVPPREIFLTLNRNKSFQFPRDIQTEVMNLWFDSRTTRDTIIKLNVGGGKTLLGLLLLQSSLNEGVSPALYVCPNNQLVAQVLDEANLLGIDAVDDPRDLGFQSGKRICVTNVHRLFNGQSIFGVGQEGIKIPIDSVVIDDAHACVATIIEQFKITLPGSHPTYATIFDLVSADIRAQSSARFLDLKDGDPLAIIEVPFWTWQDQSELILEALHSAQESKELRFSFSLLRDILPQCRCIMSGQKLEIEPIFPPADLIKSFGRASRRIYLTATLSDDSVLVTHFGADATKLGKPLVPISSQSMGERMILLPQDINPDIDLIDVRKMLQDMAKEHNVVVIVPSDRAAKSWFSAADQVLTSNDIVDGVERLREGHVGLTLLVNRYDGIDLPGDACRVLAIFDLPEVSSSRETIDQAVLGGTNASLRRQMQRVEQGMGRGVRSNDDYCVVLLCGARLTQRVRSPEGQAMLTPATKAQMALSQRITNRLPGASVDDIRAVAEQCLNRDKAWVTVSRQILLKVNADDDLRLDDTSVALRRAFDLCRLGDPVAASDILTDAANASEDNDFTAWIKVRLAEAQQSIDPAEAQRILASAHSLNSSVLRPLKGVTYQKLNPITGEQAARVRKVHQSRFLDAASRVLEAKSICDDLRFHPDRADAFEAALHALGVFIGLSVQRPEKELGEGPDNLWAFRDPHYFVIECKSGATSMQGISKSDLGQLEQSVSWFDGRYSGAISRTPIIVHPLNNVGAGATLVDGMRIVDEAKVTALSKAFCDFCAALGDENVLGDVKRIEGLIRTHNFTRKMFLTTYTKRSKA